MFPQCLCVFHDSHNLLRWKSKPSRQVTFDEEKKRRRKEKIGVGFNKNSARNKITPFRNLANSSHDTRSSWKL